MEGAREMSNVRRKKRAVVIGTGAGGSIMARELQGEYQVTMIERGKEFSPFALSVERLSGFRHSGFFLTSV